MSGAVRASALSAVVLLGAALAACDAPAATDDAGTAPAGDAGTVTVEDAGGLDPSVVAGRVLYEDRPFDADGFTGELVPTPAAEVLVEVHDAAGALVASGRTDADGGFRLSVADAPPGALTVRASADVLHEGHGARVVDRQRAENVYAVEAPVVPGAAVELLARHEEGLGGPFNVVDASRDAFVLYAPHVGAPGPTLTYRWEQGRAFSCGSCYGGDVVSLGGQLEDTDEYDDDIILHELGHYFVEHYSHDTSPAGAHRDMQVEPELAYGEGLAYFFACMVRDTPIVVDTFLGATRVIDIEEYLQNGESQPDFLGTADGDLREEIVAGILWDAFDAARPEEPFDRVQLGVGGQLELLIGLHGGPAVDVGAAGMDLADYLRTLECDAGVPTDDVQALADDREFPYLAGGC